MALNTQEIPCYSKSITQNDDFQRFILHLRPWNDVAYSYISEQLDHVIGSDLLSKRNCKQSELRCEEEARENYIQNHCVVSPARIAR